MCRCQVPGVRCQMSGAKCSRCQVLKVFQMSGTLGVLGVRCCKCQESGVRCQVLQVSGVQCVRSKVCTECTGARCLRCQGFRCVRCSRCLVH